MSIWHISKRANQLKNEFVVERAKLRKNVNENCTNTKFQENQGYSLEIIT